MWNFSLNSQVRKRNTDADRSDPFSQRKRCAPADAPPITRRCTQLPPVRGHHDSIDVENSALQRSSRFDIEHIDSTVYRRINAGRCFSQSASIICSPTQVLQPVGIRHLPTYLRARAYTGPPQDSFFGILEEILCLAGFALDEEAASVPADPVAASAADSISACCSASCSCVSE